MRRKDRRAKVKRSFRRRHRQRNERRRQQFDRYMAEMERKAAWWEKLIWWLLG
jgi:hypothetical protein